MRTPLFLAFVACALAAVPAFAAPTLEECAAQALQPSGKSTGVTPECDTVLKKATASGEMEKRGGLTALAKAYKADSDQANGGWDLAKCRAEIPKIASHQREAFADDAPCHKILLDGARQPAEAQAAAQAAPIDEEFKGIPDDQARELSALKKACSSTTLGYWNAGDYALGGPCKELAARKKPALEKLDKDCEAYKDQSLADIDTADAKAMKEACINRGDQKLGLDREKLKTPEQCRDAMSALLGPKPGADAKDKGTRLGDICAPVVGDMLKNWDHKSELPGLAVFQSVCNQYHTEALCIATGQNKKLPTTVPSVAPGANEAGTVAQTFFHNDAKMKEYFEKNPDKLKSFNDAYSKCSAQKGRAGDDCMVELQRNWLIDNPGTANSAIPDKFYKKAPGKRDLLQAIIDRQGWNDQMKQRFRGNLDKMSPKQFESNYAGVVEGRPRTEAGRQYLANACQGLPDWKKDEALTASELRGICGRFQQSEQRRAAQVPAPVMTPQRTLPGRASARVAAAAQPPQDLVSAAISRMMAPFANSNPKGYVCRLKGTDIACHSAGETGCECREVR